MLQNIMFDITQWSSYKAKKWLKEHGFTPIKNEDTTST